jgi:hypothetical protein
MRLAAVIKSAALLTLVCLGYVHLQMKIIELAYQGKSREKQIRNLIEENGTVTYNILTLTSSINLGHRLLDDNMKMTFVDPGNVITMSASGDVFNDGPVDASEVARTSDYRKSIFGLLSLGSSAEARINH